MSRRRSRGGKGSGLGDDLSEFLGGKKPTAPPTAAPPVPETSEPKPATESRTKSTSTVFGRPELPRESQPAPEPETVHREQDTRPDLLNGAPFNGPLVASADQLETQDTEPTPEPPPATRLETEDTKPQEREAAPIITTQNITDPNCSSILVLEQLDAGNNPIREMIKVSTKAKIGNADKNQIRIDDDSVSELHAAIGMKDGGFFIADNKSGTIVNGEQIKRTMLNQGDVIEIGRAKLRVREIVEVRPETLDPEPDTGPVAPPPGVEPQERGNVLTFPGRPKGEPKPDTQDQSNTKHETQDTGHGTPDTEPVAPPPGVEVHDPVDAYSSEFQPDGELPSFGEPDAIPSSVPSPESSEHDTEPRTQDTRPQEQDSEWDSGSTDEWDEPPVVEPPPGTEPASDSHQADSVNDWGEEITPADSPVPLGVEPADRTEDPTVAERHPARPETPDTELDTEPVTPPPGVEPRPAPAPQQPVVETTEQKLERALNAVENDLQNNRDPAASLESVKELLSSASAETVERTLNGLFNLYMATRNMHADSVGVFVISTAALRGVRNPLLDTSISLAEDIDKNIAGIDQAPRTSLANLEYFCKTREFSEVAAKLTISKLLERDLAMLERGSSQSTGRLEHLLLGTDKVVSPMASRYAAVYSALSANIPGGAVPRDLIESTVRRLDDISIQRGVSQGLQNWAQRIAAEVRDKHNLDVAQPGPSTRDTLLGKPIPAADIAGKTYDFTLAPGSEVTKKGIGIVLERPQEGSETRIYKVYKRRGLSYRLLEKVEVPKGEERTVLDRETGKRVKLCNQSPKHGTMERIIVPKKEEGFVWKATEFLAHATVPAAAYFTGALDVLTKNANAQYAIIAGYLLTVGLLIRNKNKKGE